MAIEETISVSAGSAVEQVNAVADAFEAMAAKAAEAAGKVNASLRSVGEGAGGAGTADKLAASMDAAAASISSAAARINAAVENIGAAADAAAGSVGRMDEAAAAAEGSLSGAAAAADEAAGASDRLAESADAAGASLDRQAASGRRAGTSAEGAAASAGGFWSGLKTVMLGAGIAAAYGIDKAMKFQSQMLLLHTQAGVSVGDTQKMSQGVLLISTQTGQSLSGLSESAYHVASNMASMGATVPQMLGAVKIAAEGASVGHAGLVDTTNAMTAAIASGIPGVQNYQQAMGVLNATVGSGDMSMQDLAEAFGGGMVATVKGYGLTLKDVGAATAVFGDNNIRGAKAGTDLRMAVQALAVPMKTAPLEKFGLQQDTLAKDMQKGGLTKALDDLTGRFKTAGLTSKTEGEWITALFGKKAGSGIAVLLEQMDRYHSKLPLLTKDANNFGAAWDATQATPAQKFKEMTAGFQALAVNFGTTLLPTFTKVAGFADGLLAKLNSSKGEVRDLALGLGGLAGIFTAKKLVSGVEGAVKTGETVLSAAGKVGQVLHIPGLDKLAGIGGKGGQLAGATAASAGLGEVATSADAAAAALGKVAEAGALPGGGVIPGKAGTEGGAAAESAAEAGALEAGGATWLSKVKTTGATALGRLLTGAIVAYTGNQVADALPKGAQQAKAPIRVASDMAGGAITGSAFGPIGTVVGGGLGLWAGLGANSNLMTYPNMYAQGARTAGGGYNAAFGKTGPTGPAYGVGTERTVQTPPAPPPPAPSEMPRMWSVPGHAGTAAAPAPVKVPQPDLSGITAGKTKAMEQLNAIGTGLKPAKVPAPDVTSIGQAKTKAMADMAAIGTAISTAAARPAKVAAPNLAELDSAKAKAGSDGQGIFTAVQTPLARPAKAASPDISAFAAARGPAASDGAGISAGLAGGILAGEGAVVAAAHQVASAAAAAMASAVQTHSPSKVTERTGEDVTGGLALGITKAKHKAKSAAIDLSASAVNSLVTGLQGGQSAIDAAMASLGSPAKPQDLSTIASTMAKLQTELQNALKKKDISKSEDSALTKFLAADNKKLQALAAQRTKLETEISDAQQIGQTAISQASILNAGAAQPTESITAQSGYQTATGMQYQAQQQSEFAAQLAQLKSQGLNATSLSQLAQGGAASGLPVTEGLVGQKGIIAQVNASQTQIMKAAGSIGDTGAPAMYQAGQQAAAGLGKGLQSQLSAVDKQMSKLASSMVDAVKAAVSGKGLEAAMKAAGEGVGQGFASGLQQEIPAVQAAAAKLAQAAETAAKDHLKARSPSMLFHELGRNTGQGYIGGVDSMASLVSAAAARMGQHAQDGWHPGAYGAAAPHGGSGAGSGTVVHVTNNITVQGQVTSMQELGSALQGVFLDRALHNYRGGLAVPYKAA